MKRIVIAVVLSLIGPGLGQLYNRDFKKGILLLVLSVIVLLAPVFWLIAKVTPLLPDPRQQIVTQEMVQSTIITVVQGKTHFLNLVTFIFLGLWAYSITEAYFKARAKEKAEQTKS